MNNINKCGNCGANSFTNNICDYCSGEITENIPTETKVLKRTVISMDMGKYDTIENTTLRGDMNTVKKSNNVTVKGGMNKVK